MKEYKPEENDSFDVLDDNVEKCYNKGEIVCRSLIPSTMEGFVVRISDIIVYFGKDRQDAKIAKIIDNNTAFTGK